MPYKSTTEEVAKELMTDLESGLTTEGIVRNREKYGSNELTRTKRKSFIARFFDAAKEPMILILIAAWVISLGVNIFKTINGGTPEYAEVIGILCAILLCILITVFMEGRSAKAFEALSSLRDDILVKVVRDGKAMVMSQSEVVVGDVIHLTMGDKIPVDMRLIESRDMTVDESALTGESVPVEKDANIVFDRDMPLAERVNMLYGGCFISTGTGSAVVTAVGDDTEFGKIAKELGTEKEGLTPLQEKLGKLGKTISLLGCIMAAIIFAIEFIRLAITGGINFESILSIFISSIVLIVAAVPEGLPTIVAISLALIVIKMAKQNALVKKLVACETVGCINVICSDKTGTLTENKMTAVEFWDGGHVRKPEEMRPGHILTNIVSNSDGEISYDENGKAAFIGNSTECAMLVAYDRSAGGQMRYKEAAAKNEKLRVFPFSSDLKNMTTVVRGETITAYSKGSPEKILALCDRVTIDGEVKKLTKALREEIALNVEKYQKRAMRTLAFAHGEADEICERCDAERDMIYDGFVAITDPVREDVHEAVKTCKKAGISLKMLTGDNVITARAIAEDLKMLDEGGLVFEAREIEEMDDEELNANIDNIRVIARSTPATKQRIVEMLKKRGNVVAVTGDGINDAPAIKNADVGIAMGITGTEVSKEASDIILLNDSFSTIVGAVRWGRGIYENFRRFIQFQLTVNVASVLLVFLSVLLGFDAPFSALELLWINVIMDGPPALSLGLEPLHDGLMDRPPTPRDSSIVSAGMMRRIIAVGVYTVGLVMLQMYTNILGGTPEQQSTIIFTVFILFQMINAFNCRAIDHSSMFKGFFKNKLLIWMFLLAFVLQIAITEFGGDVFGTVPLPFIMWVKMAGYAATTIVFSELYRFIARKMGRA